MTFANTFEGSLRCRCSSGSHSRGAHQSSPHDAQTSAFFITESKAQHAPDRLVDVTHIKIECSVDLKEKLLKGSCSTDFTVVAPKIDRVSFDALELQVESVTDGSGAELKFERTDKKLNVFLRKDLAHGDASRVVVKYHVQEPQAGLYFIAPTKEQPLRPLQLWTQGQDEDNRYWFPCHDAPNEKATTEMIVTVADHLTAVSNGALVNSTHDVMAKRRTFHWKQSIPHASYLVTLCVGEFIELKDTWKNSQGLDIPVNYYTLPGREKETKFCFGKTPKMMEFFSKKLGVEYPYEKYSQVVAWDFIYGGMENTSATTQTEYTLHPESIEQEYSSEYLVAHELAHQWFGDLVTCKSWHHAWLNEGFATYCEGLWTEHEHGTDEFLYELYGHEQMYKEEQSGDYSRPIVTNLYLKPSDIFDRHLYEKGGRVLHMLRNLVGDDSWWAAVRLYLSRHKESTVETIDLRRAFEETTGRSLEWFFEQWIYKTAHPQLAVAIEWSDETKSVKVQITQKQKTGSLVPVFRLPLVIKVVAATGDTLHCVDVTEKEHTYNFSSHEKPLFVNVNVGNTVLGDWEITQDREALLNQMRTDKDVMGRVAAVRALAKDHSRVVVDSLASALKTEKFWGVHIQICKALGKVGSPAAKAALAAAVKDLAHPKARRAALDALATYGCELTAAVAETALREDLSPLVQQGAGVALGKTRLTGVFEKLSMAIGRRESWHDYYDIGIVQGLAQLKGDERVLPLLLKALKPEGSMFLRRAAVGAIASYACAKPQMVMGVLLDLLKDQNFFVRINAIHALESLSEAQAIGPLKTIVDTVVEPRTRRSALMAMKRLREGKGPLEELEKVKTDFDILRNQYTALLGRLEKLEAHRTDASHSKGML